MEFVILVNEKDEEHGVAEKMQVHRQGLLHRAFSVFIFDSNGNMLLQRRAAHKYHSGGLWTNACCSHPRPGEKTGDAAKRRLKEEMGIECNLRFKSSFVYKASFDNGLTEHEFDHIFEGRYDSDPRPDPEEVSEFRWIKTEKLKRLVNEKPEQYTYWFRLAMNTFY